MKTYDAILDRQRVESERSSSLVVAALRQEEQAQQRAHEETQTRHAKLRALGWRLVRPKSKRKSERWTHPDMAPMEYPANQDAIRDRVDAAWDGHPQPRKD